MGDDIKKITICVCTYDNYALLFDCLQRLINQSLNDTHYDVIILDNTPTSVSNKSLNCVSLISKHKNFNYVIKETDGLSGARNECVKLSTSELIHFIDDDALVSHTFVENTLKCFSNHRDLSVMGGRVLPNWTRCERPTWLCDEALGYLSMLDFGDKELLFKDGMWFVGANICFKRSVIEQYGGFSTHLGRKGDQNTLISGEEMELIYKMKSSEKLLYCPNVIVHHVVNPERIKQSWHIKRASWQAVSDIMTNTYYMEKPGTWSDNKHGYEFLKDEIQTLFSESNSSEMFSRKLKVAKMLSFWLLNDFKQE